MAASLALWGGTADSASLLRFTSLPDGLATTSSASLDNFSENFTRFESLLTFPSFPSFVGFRLLEEEEDEDEEEEDDDDDDDDESLRTCTAGKFRELRNLKRKEQPPVAATAT